MIKNVAADHGQIGVEDLLGYRPTQPPRERQGNKQMLGFLRYVTRTIKSTWAAFTSDCVSRQQIERDQAAHPRAAIGETPKDEHVDRRITGGPSDALYRGAERIRDNGPTPQIANYQTLRCPVDESWGIYALRDWWGCGEHRENMLEADDKLPSGFSFKTRAEAEAYRLARPWIHDAYIQDDVSGAVAPPLRHGYWVVNWPPGKAPTSWPPTPDDYQAARRYAMRDWPPDAGSPYEWVDVPWQGP